MNIDQNKCIGCHACQGVCPAQAINIKPDGKCEIDTSKCLSCMTCASICPMGAISD